MYDMEYSETYYGNGMGFALPVAVSAITSIGGLFADNKDPGRLAANTKAYADAQAGNLSASTYLKARSGRYGLVPIVPVWGGDPVSPLGGWATSKAKDDAFAKYNSLSGSSSAYEQPSTVTPGAITGVEKMGGPVVAGMSAGPLMLAGAAALAIYFMTKR